MISILTTNIFKEQLPINLLMENLKKQTIKDFQLVLMDGFYNQNKDLVQELSEKYSIKNIIHAPMCGATHVARTFHWELYNNALLLCDNDLFVRIGVYRIFRDSLIEIILKNYEDGFLTDLQQQTSRGETSLDEELKIVEIEDDTMSCYNGMFSFLKDDMLAINGNEEAAMALYSQEDIEITIRFSKLAKVKLRRLENGLYRMDHDKEPKNNIPFLEEKTIMPCLSDCCIEKPSQMKFEYDNFTWLKCPRCNAIAPSSMTQYFEHVRNNQKCLANIGVDGILGRDLRILNEDIKKLQSLSSKIELLKSSHTDKKYLGG